ncbi:MAG: NUMOD3 domain-containing DNA-binding protein [Thermoplasmatales archaeon]
MANKIKFWEETDLKRYNLIDCTPRHIARHEIVDVFCDHCKKGAKLKFSVLLSKMHSRGLKWRCAECVRKEHSERGRLLTGKKNPFYGKRHTQEARARIAKGNKKKWEHFSKEEIQEIMIKARMAAYKKYDGNPMSNEHVREAYNKAIMEFFNDAAKVASRQEKIRQTNIKKYGNSVFIHSEHYISDCQKFKSKAEKELTKIFEAWGLTSQKRRKDGIEIDVFVPEKKFGIEMNGCYFHSELFRDRTYHLKKTEYCDLNQIKLIQIFDHEWEGRKSQILSFLKSSLNLNEIKINGRECEVVNVNRIEANEFLDKFHIQGKCSAKIYLGLKYKDELVSVAAFGYHHRNNNTWVLKRFAGKQNVTVSGGLSKICKYASQLIQADIITWCDRRWSNGNGYLKSGWVPESIIPPDYFYIKNGRFFCSKQSRRKKIVNTPNGMTEREHAKLDGLLRVYDCGKIRFIYKYKQNQ